MKLGRLFARSGWSKTSASTSDPHHITVKDLRELKGNLLGLLRNMAHVPPALLWIQQQLNIIERRFTVVRSKNPNAELSPIYAPDVARRPMLTNTYSPSPDFITFITERYGVTFKQIMDFAHLVIECNELPMLLSCEFTRICILKDC
jgi:hypothetical protein